MAWEVEVHQPESRRVFGLEENQHYAMAVPLEFARQLERELASVWRLLDAFPKLDLQGARKASGE